MLQLRIAVIAGVFAFAQACVGAATSDDMDVENPAAQDALDALVAEVSEDDPVRKYAVFKFVYEHRKQLPDERPRALQLLGEAASEGYAIAQYNLAILYYYGQWVEEDRDLALRWMMMAAKSGMPEAQLETGSQLYELAVRVEVEQQRHLYLVNSEYWIRQALSSDDLDEDFRLRAEALLARTITFGDSTNPEGWKMLIEAACAGQEEAITLLKEDRALAEKWAADGNEQAQKVLAGIDDNYPGDCSILK